MDIELIIKKTIVFAGLSLAILAAIAFASIFVQEVVGAWLGLPKIVSLILSAVLIAAIFDPVRKALEHLTENILFQKKYNPLELLKLFSREILTELELDKIIEATKHILDSTIHPELFSVYLVDDRKDKYVTQGQSPPHAFEPTTKLVTYLNASKKILSLEGRNHKPNSFTGALGELKSLKMVLAIPLIHRDHLVGFMLLGKKKSDEEYTEEDLGVLEDLAIQESIAITNAKANAELAKIKATQQLGTMADGMSHQFNNRFQAIMALLGLQGILIPEAIKETEVLIPEEQAKKLKELLTQALQAMASAHANAERGGVIAKTILNHTRPERAGFAVQDISKAVQIGLSLVGLKHQDLPSIEIKEHIEPNLPPTWSNISLLQDIFLITIDNAYDAIKSKKQTDPAHKGKIDIYMTHKILENLIRIVIKDNGIGMPAKDLEAVNAFVPYFTTKGSSSEKSGYGAGVHTLGSFVGLLGGRLRYESTPGEGTTCIIDLAVRQKPKEEEAPLKEKKAYG